MISEDLGERLDQLHGKSLTYVIKGIMVFLSQKIMGAPSKETTTRRTHGVGAVNRKYDTRIRR